MENNKKDNGIIKAIKQNKKYMLCIGTYKDYDNVVNAKKEIEKLGIDCFIVVKKED